MTQSIVKQSKLSLVICIGFVLSVFGGLIYLFELSPAKSWNVKSVIQCTTQLNDNEVAKEILDQIGEKPAYGKINRLDSKCRELVEEQNSLNAMQLLAEAKKNRS